MSGLSGALCRGRWWLFDSTDYRDHVAAAELCAECPVIEACRALLRDTSTIAYGGGKGGYIQGTWAGELFGRKGRKRPQIPAEPCGQRAGLRGRPWENKDEPDRSVSALQPGSDRLPLLARGEG